MSSRYVVPEMAGGCKLVSRKSCKLPGVETGEYDFDHKACISVEESVSRMTFLITGIFMIAYLDTKKS